jgi:hypothetical protein
MVTTVTIEGRNGHQDRDLQNQRRTRLEDHLQDLADREHIQRIDGIPLLLLLTACNAIRIDRSPQEAQHDPDLIRYGEPSTVVALTHGNGDL